MGDEDDHWCYLHPKEGQVGVCPLCLNERLLILAAKKSLNSKYYNFSTNYNNYNKPRYNYYTRPKTTSCRVSLRIPNIFALGSLRLRGRWKSNHHPGSLDFPDSTSTTSEDESFISIKFEENGEISWDKTTSNVSNVSLEHCNMTCPSQTLVKHTRNQTNMLTSAKSLTTPLRWRVGIGRLLKVMRWRRSSKANAGLGK